jgi:hypothetical protein
MDQVNTEENAIQKNIPNAICLKVYFDFLGDFETALYIFSS